MAGQTYSSDAAGVILFDGVCNLCNGWVRFVLDRDPHGKFRFAPLQSDTGRALLDKFNLSPDALDSIVLVEKSGYHLKSTAVLRIFRRLGMLGLFFYTFIIVPRSWRDKIYDFVAANRYNWLGRTDRCAVAQPHLSDRFLE